MRKQGRAKILAVDIGGTKTRLAVVSEKEILFLEKRKTPLSEEALLGLLSARIERILKKMSVDGIAVSLAGPVKKDGRVYLTNITKTEIDLQSFLEKRFDLAVVLVNDGLAAVLAEKKYGYGRGKKNLLYITLSTGIGGGAVKDGRLVWFSDIQDEFGHQVIDRTYKTRCGCGGIGHWESLTSGRALAEFMKAWAKREGKRIDPEKYRDVFDVFSAYAAGDRLVGEFLKEAGRINAAGIDRLDRKFRPEVIVLGGSVALCNREVIEEGIKRYLKTETPLEFSRLGDEISLLGAVAYFELQKG